MSKEELNFSENIISKDDIDRKLFEIADFLKPGKRMGRQFNADKAQEYFDELEFLAKKINEIGEKPSKYVFKFHGRDLSFADLLGRLRTLIDKYEQDNNTEDALIMNKKYHFDFKTVEDILALGPNSLKPEHIYYIKDSIEKAGNLIESMDPVKGFSSANRDYTIENLNAYIQRMKFWLSKLRSVDK